MKYTVIQTSGWQGASWRIEKTFDTKQEASDFVDENAQSNPRDDFYNTAIMAHKKSLVDLMGNSESVVTFADGTKAVVPW